MSSQVQSAFPLAWPAGWKRTPAWERQGGQFDGTLDKVRREVIREIDALVLGVKARTHTVRDYVVISTNLPLRKDGEPRADTRDPEDPGVAIYFNRNKQPFCLACDKYDRVWKNLRALQRTLEALRGIERWGSSQLLERAFEGFVALPERTQESCWEVLGISPDAGEAEVMAAYRLKAKSAHPDVGGSHEAFARLSAAKDIALATINARRTA